jgi:hypothetical protein
MTFFNSLKTNAQKMRQIVDPQKHKITPDADVKITQNTIQFSIDDEEDEDESILPSEQPTLPNQNISSTPNQEVMSSDSDEEQKAPTEDQILSDSS